MFRNKGAAIALLFAVTLCFTVIPAMAQAEESGSAVQGEDGSLLTDLRWSPYWVGAGIGVLSMFTFVLSDHPIGVSTAYARTAGMVQKLFQRRTVEENAYYQKFPPKVDWEWMFVLGIFIGAFLSAQLSGRFVLRMVPTVWQETAGPSGLLRWIFALVGGAVMGLGARWARGCTSGHGISGTLQLAVSSWIVLISLFASGVLTAMVLYYGFFI
ncbi:putative inner membrane protein [Anaerohalosphaera lusitana]|uniref:Putative inner membrane protein n=1 Tax=Anaerohalosphaera lusitana TaxID=1936003 RepID=A0A1U9NQX3_9BACT|nr:YeeE/YedE thiosulfate transporter family protein [Anaerohalosphaera lusitana]AQT70144.1 putative inner membrane protein [Anaerohalosphaera lusitana]